MIADEGMMWVGRPSIAGGRGLNQSKIAHNLKKLALRPSSLRETQGYREQWNDHDHQKTRHYFCSWGQRKACIDWLLGYSYSSQDQSNPTKGILHRVSPAQDPECPWMYCVNVDVEGHGAFCDNPHVYAVNESGSPTGQDSAGTPLQIPAIAYYDRGGGKDDHTCHLTATFRPLPYQIRDDDEMSAAGLTSEMERWVERQTSYAMQEIALPPGGLIFKEGPYATKTVPANAARLLIPTRQVKWIWRDVPDPPEEAMDTCTGRVNIVEFDGAKGWKTYEPETLLLLPPQTERYRTPTGRASWNIIYTAMYRKTGWNSFPAANGVFYPAELSNGDKVFKSAIFSHLFWVPGPMDW